MSAKKKPAEKPKKRTAAELRALAKKVAHGDKMTEDQAFKKLAAAEDKKVGQGAYQLVAAAFDDKTAARVFSDQKKPVQGQLPKKPPTGAELTAELCNLEIKLRRQKSALVEANLEKDAASKKVKGAEADVQKTQDAIAECLYDLRSGQGRISFPAKKPAGKDAAAA